MGGAGEEERGPTSAGALHGEGASAPVSSSQYRRQSRSRINSECRGRGPAAEGRALEEPRGGGPQ